MLMAKIWRTGVLLALALAACEEQPRQNTMWGPVPPAQGPEQPPARVDTAFMQGDWRLAAMGRWPPQSGTPAITLNITADRIEAQSQCKRFAWTYALTEQRFAAAKASTGEPDCERTASLWEQSFEETVSRANSAEMQADGGLLIKGAGGELELKRS